MFNNNNPTALQKELSGLSKVMGRPDITTTFQGDGAWADGKNVNVPEMDVDAQLSDAEMAALRGYHIHEVAHITETDYDTWKGKRPNARKRRTWNAMEDVFIERKAQEQYAGARKNLEATVEAVLARENEIDAKHRAQGADPYKKWWDSIDYAALQLARKRMGYESEALDTFIDNMPAKLRKEAEAFVDDALEADSTEDTYKVAGKVHRRMNALGKQNEDDDDQQQQQQSSAGGGDQQADQQQQGDDGNGDGSGSGCGSGDEDDGATEGTSAKERMDRASDVASTIASKHRSHDASEFDTNVANTFKSYEEYHEHLLAQVDASDHFKGKVSEKNKRAVSMMRSASEPGYRASYSDYQKMNSQDAAQKTYAARLARLLLAREDKRYVGGQLAGRVDRRRLAQLIAGQKNVFAHTEALRTDNTIVSIAVDASASMDMKGSRQALACINDTLFKANVDYEMLAWTGYSHAPDVAWACGLGDWVAPFNTNGLVEMKTVNQRGNSPAVQKNLANFLKQRGVTPTYPATMAMAQRMLAHTHERRIMLFVTDGMPNGGRDAINAVRKVSDAMRDVGIEVIGVCLSQYSGSSLFEYVQDMFGKEHSIESTFDALGTTLLGQLETMLMGRAHEAA